MVLCLPFCLVMLLVTLQGLPSNTPTLCCIFMQHLEICLPRALLLTEAYFSFQLSLKLNYCSLDCCHKHEIQLLPSIFSVFLNKIP